MVRCKAALGKCRTYLVLVESREFVPYLFKAGSLDIRICLLLEISNLKIVSKFYSSLQRLDYTKYTL